MPRDSIVGTFWRPQFNAQGAWGTNGTQSMVPAPHIEGLGSFAAKLDDRICFLAFQQADTIFSETENKGYTPGNNILARMEAYHVYYNGCHPQLAVGFRHQWRGDPGAPATGTYSLRFANTDFGTIRMQTAGGTSVMWFADLPDSFAAGEHLFALFGGAAFGYSDIYVSCTWAAYLPVRLF